MLASIEHVLESLTEPVPPRQQQSIVRLQKKFSSPSLVNYPVYTQTLNSHHWFTWAVTGIPAVLAILQYGTFCFFSNNTVRKFREQPIELRITTRNGNRRIESAIFVGTFTFRHVRELYTRDDILAHISTLLGTDSDSHTNVSPTNNNIAYPTSHITFVARDCLQWNSQTLSRTIFSERVNALQQLLPISSQAQTVKLCTNKLNIVQSTFLTYHQRNAFTRDIPPNLRGIPVYGLYSLDVNEWYSSLPTNHFCVYVPHSARHYVSLAHTNNSIYTHEGAFVTRISSPFLDCNVFIQIHDQTCTILGPSLYCCAALTLYIKYCDLLSQLHTIH